MEIQLAELAVSKSSNDSLKTLAGLLVTEHSQMLAELQGLSIAPGAPMSDSGQVASQSGVATDSLDHHNMSKDSTNGTMYEAEMNEKMQALQTASGAEFDRQWLANMLSMHEKKLKELEMASKTIKDEQLKSVVLDAIPKVRAHTEGLKSLAKKGKGKSSGGGLQKM